MDGWATHGRSFGFAMFVRPTKQKKDSSCLDLVCGLNIRQDGEILQPGTAWNETEGAPSLTILYQRSLRTRGKEEQERRGWTSKPAEVHTTVECEVCSSTDKLTRGVRRNSKTLTFLIRATAEEPFFLKWSINQNCDWPRTALTNSCILTNTLHIQKHLHFWFKRCCNKIFT